MRLLRSLGVVVGAVALTLGGLPGAAGAAPTAPYDAFTVNGTWSHSFDSSNATLTLTMNGPGGFILRAVQPGAGNDFTAKVNAPTGQKLSVGTFATDGMGNMALYGLKVSGNGAACDNAIGSITIQAITLDASTGDVTSLAASYHQQSCVESFGELRWKSDLGYVDAVQSPSSVGFGTLPVGQASMPTVVTFTSTGSDPLKLGAAQVTGADAGPFTITANSCTNATLAVGQSCAVTLVGRSRFPGDHSATLTIGDNSTFGSRQVLLDVVGRATAQGEFVPVTPYRMLDTRSGLGAPGARPLGASGTMDLQLTGRGPVPTQGVAAVVLNVTVTAPTTGGYLTIYPTGKPRPTASSINFPANWTGANSVTVPVSADGRVTIFNPAGNTHVIVDISGYYATDDLPNSTPSLGLYQPNFPVRVLDTRDAGAGGALRGGQKIITLFDYGSDVNRHVRAVAVNITAVAPQTAGFLTAWNGLNPVPTASTLNFTAGATVPNFAIVPTAACQLLLAACLDMPSVTILNAASGSVQIVVDVVGFYDDTQLAGGLRFTPINPTRIVDSRVGLGAPQRLGPNSTTTVTAPSSVAGPDTVALSMNVTGVNPDTATYLTLYPGGGQRPTTSTLNLTAHEIRSNAAAVLLDVDNQFSIFNPASTVDVVIDVAGRFDAPSSAANALTGPSALRPFTPKAGVAHRQPA